MHLVCRSFLSTKLFFLTVFFLGLLLVHIAQAAAVAQESIKLTFGVVPQQSATKLAKKWGPIFEYLSNKTGYRINFKTAKNIPTFEKRCSLGEYDITYMNPYHYVHFHNSPGYNVFAREQLKSLKGIIVVRKDSPYRNLEEFSGNILAFPSPAAFAASIVTRAHLSSLGIPITPQYVSSHDSVYRTVCRGLFPAGGGIPRTFNNLSQETRDQLRILWTSKEFTPHAFAAHPRIPKETVATLQKAMIDMANDSEGKGLLERLAFKGLVAAENLEWDDVRALDLTLLAEEKVVK